MPLSDIVVADLSDWRYRPEARPGRRRPGARPDRLRRRGPRPGRACGSTTTTRSRADMGGGEYDRDREPPPGRRGLPGRPRRRRTSGSWTPTAPGRTTAGPAAAAPRASSRSRTAAPTRSSSTSTSTRATGSKLRAAEGTRPVIRLLDWYSNRPDALNIRAVSEDCAPPSAPRIVLDGLLVTGRGINVTGPDGRRRRPALHARARLVAGARVRPALAGGAEPRPGTHHRVPPDRAQHPRHHPGHRRRGAPRTRSTSTSATASSTPPADDREALSAPDCRHAHAVLHAAPHDRHRRDPHARRARSPRTRIFTGPAARGPARHRLPALLLRARRVAHAAPVPLPAGPGGPEQAGRVRPLFTSPSATARPRTGSWPTAAPRRSGAAPTTAPRWAPSTTCTSRSARTACGPGSPSTRPAGTDAGIFFVT